MGACGQKQLHAANIRTPSVAKGGGIDRESRQIGASDKLRVHNWYGAPEHSGP